MVNNAAKIVLFSCLSTVISGCASFGGGTWVALVDGNKGLENFNQVNVANWAGKDGSIQANSGGNVASYLVSKKNYKDFMIRAEFWSSHDANSGIFVRCQNPKTITDENCYEVNIFDQRPDPTYSTGSIVKVAKVYDPLPKAGGKWNTFEITAYGNRVTVFFNGVKTVEVDDSKLTTGLIALQWGKGEIKFRKVEIKEL